MSGGRKAAWFLILMAVLALVGFSLYARFTGDGDGISAGIITAALLLALAWLSAMEFRP